MNDKTLRVFSAIGSIGWLLMAIAAVADIVRSVITGSGSAMWGLMVLALIAINFNISVLISYKRREYENTTMILEKSEQMLRGTSTGRANPYLN